MRVSERQRYNVTTDRVERAKTSNSKMLEKMSTQKRISRLSDDPVGMGQAIREKDRIARQNQYQKNVLFAQGFIERTESAISGIADFLIRAKELAVQQANATYGAAGRKSTSMEVRQIMDGVIALANTSSLKAHRSSRLPPPRVTSSTSGLGCMRAAWPMAATS